LALLAEARERYAARDDALGVGDVDQRMRALRSAKAALKAAQSAPDNTEHASTTKGRPT
jgi:hypothetical protein